MKCDKCGTEIEMRVDEGLGRRGHFELPDKTVFHGKDRCIAILTEQLDAVTAERAMLVTLMKEHQWNRTGHCPKCSAYRHLKTAYNDEHREDCPVALLCGWRREGVTP